MAQNKSILCIGIDNNTVSSLHNYFRETFDFVVVATAQELMANLASYSPSLIFLNNWLPDFENAQEICIGLRSNSNTETVPILMLTGKPPEQKEKIKFFQAGLIDGYFTMPLNIEEVAAYANAFLQRQALQEELEEKNRLLSEISITDDLMQIYNRRYLMKRLDEEIKRIKRYNYPLSALMIDLDYFKKINDTYGHTQGDKALRGLAELLQKNIRAMDILCRYGGEEIVILMPHTNFRGATLTGERIRSKVKANNFGSADMPLNITVSIGLITFDGEDKVSLDSVISYLDNLLYKAKNNGRDQVCASTFKTFLKENKPLD